MLSMTNNVLKPYHFINSVMTNIENNPFGLKR